MSLTSRIGGALQKAFESVTAKVLVAILLGAWGALKADSLVGGELSRAAPFVASGAASDPILCEEPPPTNCPDCPDWASMVLTMTELLHGICPSLSCPPIPDCPDFHLPSGLIPDVVVSSSPPTVEVYNVLPEEEPPEPEPSPRPQFEPVLWR